MAKADSQQKNGNIYLAYGFKEMNSANIHVILKKDQSSIKKRNTTNSLISAS